MPKHFEKRVLPFSPEQLFALVADVERYPEFLPWCVAARLGERRGNTVTAEMEIGYKALRERFSTINTLEEPSRISVSYASGPLTHLVNEWRFTPVKRNKCELSFFVDFHFRSHLLGALMDVFFEKAFGKMVAAFEKRAYELYGHHP